MNANRVMKFSVEHLGVEQEVQLGWLAVISNAAELLRAATLQVGESTTLKGNSSMHPGEAFHVKRTS